MWWRWRSIDQLVIRNWRWIFSMRHDFNFGSCFWFSFLLLSFRWKGTFFKMYIFKNSVGKMIWGFEIVDCQFCWFTMVYDFELETSFDRWPRERSQLSDELNAHPLFSPSLMPAYMTWQSLVFKSRTKLRRLSWATGECHHCFLDTNLLTHYFSLSSFQLLNQTPKLGLEEARFRRVLRFQSSNTLFICFNTGIVPCWHLFLLIKKEQASL